MRSRLLILLALLPVLLAAGQTAAWAQKLILYNLDLSRYPEVGADVLYIDKNGLPLSGFSPTDFSVVDNGQNVSPTIQIDCVPPRDPGPFAAVLVNDRSGSMVEDAAFGKTRFDLLKEGVTAFVTTADFTPPTEVALTSFADAPSIVSDFQTSPQPLLDALATIKLGGGTDYVSAFLNPKAGGIPLLATTPDTLRRVLVFLTDGYPNEPPPVDAIVNAAMAEHIVIYAITVGTPMSDELKNIAIRTGGLAFGNVTSDVQMRAIYQQIAFTSRGFGFCHLRWQTSRECASPGASHVAQVTLKPTGTGSGISYLVPPSSFIAMNVNPTVLWFGPVAPGSHIDKTITITAQNGDLSVDSWTLASGLPFSVIDWGGKVPPFTLPAGASRTITVRFAPPDSGAYNTDFRLATTPCPTQSVTLVGGARKRGTGSSLQLLEPIGGETFSGCDSVTIRWSGVDPEDSVAIEYSDDAGGHWHPITGSATGLSYRWMPTTPGSSYRIRISVQASEDNLITTVAGGGSGVDGGAAASAMLIAPTGVAILDNILFIAESGDSRIRQVDLRSGVIQTAAGTGNPGYSNDGGLAVNARLNNPNDVALGGDTLYIADFGNHRIRAIDLDTGIITTVAGIGTSGFSGDGGPATSAELQFPSHLLVSGRYLYVTDAGNNRVRRVDRTTGIITTIAGGGSQTFNEGIPATSAQLQSPAGLAILDNALFFAETGAAKVRRVDLRTGILTTVAGTGTPGSGGDDGPATGAQLQGPIGLEIAAGGLFITDGPANTVRRVDLATGVITTFAGTGTAGFGGDGGNARAAKLNYPAKPIASTSALIVPDTRNNRVRSIAFGRIAGEDESITSFTIHVGTVSVAPALAGKRVDLGRLALGRTRDSVVTAAICNTGDLPVTIDSITIAGLDPGDFQVAAGIVGTDVLPGMCRSIELIFRPGALGDRSAIAVIHGECASADTLRLSGTGVAPCGDTSLAFADLGTVSVPSTGRATLSTAICNRGSASISGNITLIPLGSPFSIVSGGGAFTLGPGECRTVVVAFTPAAPGRVTAFLDYGIPTECGAARTSIYGEGISPQHLQKPDSVAFRGALCWSGAIDTMVRLYNTGSAPLSITEISFVTNLEGFSLVSPAPSSGAPLVIAPSGSGTVTLRFDPATPGAKHATLRIVSNDPAGPATIELTGVRDSVHAEATASLLNFGRPAGAANPRDSFVVIANTGSVPLTVTGGTLGGANSAEFDIPAAQFPITVQPGDTVHIRVTIRHLAQAAGFTAWARFAVEPSCDSGVVQVTLLQPGALPIVQTDGPHFVDLTCGSATTADGIVEIRNIGGSQLRIIGVELGDDPEGNFQAGPLDPLPIAVDPDGTFALPVHFAPKSHGTKHARLVIRSNAEGDSTVVDIDATWDLVAFTMQPAGLSFDTLAPGASADRTITLVNTGTASLRWSLPASVGSFRVISVVPPVADPGGSSVVTLRFGNAPAGHYVDSIEVKELRCGTSQWARLEGWLAERVTVTVKLPIDSALSGVRVLLPVRFTADDPDAFARSGASAFSGRLVVPGLAFVVDTLVGANISTRLWNRKTGLQTITFSGTLPAGTGDVLMMIGGMTFNGDTTWKALTLDSIAWDTPGIGTQTIPGRFRVYGPCYNGQEILAAAPRLVKVAPMPVAGTARIEVDLPVAENLRVSLIDERGVERSVVVDRGFPAGLNTVSADLSHLPSGAYSLLLATPFGSTAAAVLVVR
jgi:hypothetical protein